MSDMLIGVMVGALLAMPLTAVGLVYLGNRSPSRSRCGACGSDSCVLCGSSAGPCCRAQRGPFR